MLSWSKNNWLICYIHSKFLALFTKKLAHLQVQLTHSKNIGKSKAILFSAVSRDFPKSYTLYARCTLSRPLNTRLPESAAQSRFDLRVDRILHPTASALYSIIKKKKKNRAHPRLLCSTSASISDSPHNDLRNRNTCSLICIAAAAAAAAGCRSSIAGIYNHTNVLCCEESNFECLLLSLIALKIIAKWRTASLVSLSL